MLLQAGINVYDKFEDCLEIVLSMVPSLESLIIIIFCR